DQCEDCTVFRVERHQRALGGWHLHKIEAAIFLALYADKVADLGNITWLFRARAHAVGIKEGACPLHAFPVDGFFFAVTGEYQDPTLLNLSDDCRLKSA